MVKWLKSNELVDYDYAVNFMESRASDIASNKKKEPNQEITKKIQIFHWFSYGLIWFSYVFPIYPFVGP